jgi:hypothetical protein
MRSLTVRIYKKGERIRRGAVSFGVEGLTDAQWMKFRDWILGKGCDYENHAKSLFTVNVAES